MVNADRRFEADVYCEDGIIKLVTLQILKFALSRNKFGSDC